MNWIDIFCLSLLVVFFILGLWSGLLKSIIRLAAWAGGGFGAYYARSIAGNFLRANFQVDSLSLTILCLVLGFLIPFLGIFVLGKVLGHFVKASPLSGFNRLGGGLFGLVKASIICVLFLGALQILPIQGDLRQTRNQSSAYAAFLEGIQLCNLNQDEKRLENTVKGTMVSAVKNLATPKTVVHTDTEADSLKGPAGIKPPSGKHTKHAGKKTSGHTAREPRK